MIEIATSEHLAGWLRLRAALWPEPTPETHREEISRYLARDDGQVAFVALAEARSVVGFAEGSLHRDYVNGCSTSPVVFLEGIFVDPRHRRSDIARELCAAVEAWGRAAGCSEMASDTDLANVTGQALHAALGFAETERVVFFGKRLLEVR